MTIEVLLPFSLPWSYYFISLWIVIFLRMGLNFLISILSGVFFLFFVVMYLDVPGIPEALCSVHSKITWILFPFFAIIVRFSDLFSGLHFFQYCWNSLFVDNLETSGRDIQGYPSIFFRDVEFLFGNVHVKSSLRFIDRERNIVSKHYLFPRYFTNFGHLRRFWVILLRLQIYVFSMGWTKFLIRILKFPSKASRRPCLRIFERLFRDDFPSQNPLQRYALEY